MVDIRDMYDFIKVNSDPKLDTRTGHRPLNGRCPAFRIQGTVVGMYCPYAVTGCGLQVLISGRKADCDVIDAFEMAYSRSIVFQDMEEV